RQFMLDGPMTFFTTAALAALATAMNGGSRRWLVAAGALLGAGALCKETGLVLAVAAGLFLCVQPLVWRPVRHLALAGGLALGLAFTYPLLTAVAGGGRGGQSYLLWQLTRPPNHSLAFYPQTVGASVGFVLLAAAAAGLLVRRALTWREGVLLLWMAVPLLYFEVWPTKGFAYLLPAAPVVALLAARGIRLLAGTPGAPRGRVRIRAAAGVAAVCALSLAVPAVRAVVSTPSTGLAGAGGTPGGRETGQWVTANAPVGARFMTIGPSMSNLISYYSGRHAEGLSVSTNPLHRNPSYQAIVNPDAMLRSGAYQYIVWDAVSAGRSERFGNQATQLARRFGARTVHEERAADGTLLVVVYQVEVGHTRYSAQNPSPTVTVAQPNSAALYLGYGAALAVLLGCLGWAARVDRLIARLRGAR
ncbi:MAG: hypothetical protein JWL64_2427, partial [Frankiales bacterium]|nr:hypothetical protein [Frankiales bacterium]